MTKQEFIKELCSLLQTIPQEERNAIIEYYLEMIADRMESGMTEEQAIQELGEIPAIAERHLGEYHERQEGSPAPAETVYIKKKKSAASIALIVFAAVVTSPIWLGIGISLCAAALVLYITCWIFLAVLYLTAFSLVLACLYTLVSTGFVVVINWQLAVFQAGIALLCAGIGILFAVAVVGLSKAFCRFTCFLGRKIRQRFTKKEEIVYA